MLVVGGGCSLHRREADPKPVREIGTYSEFPVGSPIQERPRNWWVTLGSVRLNEYVEASLRQSQTVEAARARLQQAEATLRRASAALGPSVDLKARLDRDIEARASREDYWEWGGALSWELDFFGRLSSARAARKADAVSRLNQLVAAKLTISAAVTEAFLGVIEQHELLVLLRRQWETSRDFLKIIQERYDQGLISLVDLLQQKSQLAEIESLIPDAESSLRVQQNVLLTLLGKPPAENATLAVDDVLPGVVPLPEIGLPSDLIVNRPDLRAARADLLASDAEIGRAMAERLPRFSFSSDGLFVDGRGREGFLWTIAPSLLSPLVDWGNRRAEVSRTKAVYRERLAIFSQQYVDAVLEVENAIVREYRQKQLIAQLEARSIILQEVLQQTKDRYTAGLTDYLPVLTSLQQLNSVEQRIIRERRRLLSFRVALHRALGGPIEMDAG